MPVLGSTFSLNVATGGAGLSNIATAFVENSTFSANQSSLGALHSFGSLVMSHSTIVDNEGTLVGGVFVGQDVTLDHSIVAQNVSPNAPDINAIGSINGGYNLIGDPASSGGFVDGVHGNQVGSSDGRLLDPRLGPLQDNGGPTMTHALLESSPAADGGNPSIAFDFLEFDQRGASFHRVANGRIDIGAFERQATLACDFDGDNLCNGADIDLLQYR